MIKVDIFSGFLGAGKTTLIKKLIEEAYKNEKLVLIENEFGDIGIDGDFLKDSGVQINEMNSGCICCTLVGDFKEALTKVVKEYEPTRILIEPSGVGKLSDIISAVKSCDVEDVVLNSFTTICDAKKVRVYMQNFGEFYNDQVEHAGAIVLSHTEGMSEEQLEKVLRTMKEKNPQATVLTTSYSELTGTDILEAIEGHDNMKNILNNLEKEAHVDYEHEHHHHDEECGCEHDHDHHDGEQYHDHDHHHEEYHDHGCSCGCGHDHGHVGHHHADEVFDSIGEETVSQFTKTQIEEILSKLEEADNLGFVLRAKGVVKGENGKWIHFDYVPGESNIRDGSAAVIGRICVIGTDLNKEEIKNIFFK